MLIANPFYGGNISLETAKRIESEALPENLQILQYVKSWDDVIDMFDLEGSNDMIIVSDSENWFALVFRGRQNPNLALLADLAKRPGSGPVDWNFLWDVLREEDFDQVYTNFREHTSYKSFKRQEEHFRRRGVVLTGDRVLGDQEMANVQSVERIHEVFIEL